MRTLSETPTASLSSLSLFSVQGRVALITGAGSGLGSYMALTLALHGAKVYLVGRRKEKLEEVGDEFEKRRAEEGAPREAKDGSVHSIVGDVSSKEGVKAIAEAFGKQEKHLDILVNNAGISRNSMAKKGVDKSEGLKYAQALLDDPWEHWAESFNTNVTSIQFVTAALAPYLASALPPSEDSAGPVVIVVTSVAGHHISSGGMISPSYQASKAAAERVTQLLAGRLQGLRIRVNAIAPGPFASEMTAALTPQMLEGTQNQTPVGRNGTIEDIAGTILYLSSRAGAFINGASIPIDGGRLLNLSAA